MELEISVPGILDGMLQGDEEAAFYKGLADDLAQAVKDWYARLPEDYFDNPALEHGTRSFIRVLAQAWYSETNGKEINVYFTHPRPGGTAWGLRLHHLGDTITPKRAKALTIPLTYRARNMTANAYSNSVRELFLVRKKDAPSPDYFGTLCEKDGQGIHAVFALRKSAEIKPLEKRRGHPAIPTPQELRTALGASVTNRLNNLLEYGRP